MTLLASGFSIREIAEDLAIGGKTVRNYLSNIYRKLGVHRQAEALIRWLSIMEVPARSSVTN
jgi:DNA-binding NarL/FixJ family response regulator